MRRNYEQIDPSYQGVVASSESLRSIQERQERKSPADLDALLARQTNLASSRRALLESLLRYNLGIVELERAKGTLLEYNNVIMQERE